MRNALDSNFAVAEFSFELPTALLFRGGAPPRGFRTPVDVHWSEQAIMLCKVSRTSQQSMETRSMEMHSQRSMEMLKHERFGRLQRSATPGHTRRSSQQSRRRRPSVRRTVIAGIWNAFFQS